jgi:hypothetical protein
MRKPICITAASLPSLFVFLAVPLQAQQQPQIPTLQVCNQTVVTGGGLVKIVSRADVGHSGTFKVEVEIKCDQSGSGYPTGVVKITSLSMSDSIVQGQINSTLIEQVTSTGKHTPTAYINGRCTAQAPTGAIQGCRYWIMFADNKVPSAPQTADVVSFLVFDGTGKRIAYGTGPLVDGDIKVAPTGN